MNTLIEILSPSFLLRDALYSSLIIGFLAPLIGAFLVLRRMIFLGVALPQVSAAGIAFAFFAYALLHQGHQHGEAGEHLLAIAGSLSFTLIALMLLAALEGKGAYPAESRVGVAYALAAALTFLFLAADPQGEAQMVNILKGDILATTQQSLITLTVTYLLVAAFVVKFRRQLTVVAFDRELAQVFRMAVMRWNALFYVAIGAVVAIGVMSGGPLVVFGFLTIPALIARAFTKHVTTFMALSSLVGGTAAFCGFYFSYACDLPLGPAEVGFLCTVLFVSTAVRKAHRLIAG